jgi:hypothetical protein
VHGDAILSEPCKSEFEVTRYIDYSERFMPYALGALMLLGLEIVLGSTLFRTAP